MTGTSREGEGGRYHRIYSDSDGESHFGKFDLELVEADQAPPLYGSEPVEAESALFFTAPNDQRETSIIRRQLYVGLTGELEVTVRSGETRHSGPGIGVLLEDTEGSGCVTSVVGDTDVHGLFVHLAMSPSRHLTWRTHTRLAA